MNTKHNKAQEAMNSLVVIVSAIEANTLPITLNHYGTYMELMPRMDEKIGNTSLTVALTLKAGGNEAGVKAAARILGWL